MSAGPCTSFHWESRVATVCSARGGAGRGEGEESGGERWAGNTTTGVRVSYTQEEGDINIYIYIGRGEAFRGARGGDGGLKGSFSPCVGILSRGCGGVGSEFYR